MSETDILHRVMLRATQVGMRVFRNNVGMAWLGKAERNDASHPVTATIHPGDVVVRHAKPVKFGIGGEGGSDLIGIKEVTITTEMVGTTIGQFVALEVKTSKGKVKPSQINFLSFVTSMGGRGLVVRSPDDI
jgi:hypothetical protein